jgi:tricorn protease interacting factor F2/3
MSLPAAERWGYVHDAGAFLLSGDYTLEEFVETLRAVATATDYATVAEVCEFVQYIHPQLSESELYASGVREFMRTQLERLGLEPRPGEDDLVGLQREWVTWVLVRFDPEFARSLAPRADHLETEPASLRQAILSSYAAYGPPEQNLDRLFGWVQGEDSDLSMTASFALEMLRTPGQRARALDRTLTAEVRLLMASRIIRNLAIAPEGRALVWAWLQQNLPEFARRARGSPLLGLLLARLIPLVGVGREAEMRAYFGPDRFPEGAIGTAKGLEYLEVFSRLRARTLGARPAEPAPRVSSGARASGA